MARRLGIALAGLALCLALALSYAEADAIADGAIDDWEDELIACLDGSDGACLRDLVALYGEEGDKEALAAAESLGTDFESWLGEEETHAVHVLFAHNIGGAYERRLYLVRSTSGENAGLYIVFRKVLDAWRISRATLTGDEDRIADWLGVEL